MKINCKRKRSRILHVRLGWRVVSKRRARKLYKRGEPVMFHEGFQVWMWLPSYTHWADKHIRQDGEVFTAFDEAGLVHGVFPSRDKARKALDRWAAILNQKECQP